ncbi:MAG: tRNA lysidine(34) synthetase TilS [Bacteroidales bacterium]
MPISTSIYDRFNAHLRQHKLLLKGEKVLLAVSGGMDSMAMTELFRASSYQFAIAHCNFQLRGVESEKDQVFVEQQAAALGVDCYIKRFNTESHAQRHKLSIQMAARELRYDWLEETRQRTGCDAIATGHHLDDAIETLLINISRGTGVEGLKGIPGKNRNVIRPLLFTGREEIALFVREQNLSYREDHSNQETKYLRNKLRHQVLPVLKEINPELCGTIDEFFSRMNAAATFYHLRVNQAREACVQQSGQETHILLGPLRQLAHSDILLYEFLKNFGFTPNACKDIFQKIEVQPGREFSSATHHLLKDRDKLIIYPIGEQSVRARAHEVKAGEKALQVGKQHFTFRAAHIEEISQLPTDPHILTTDLDKLEFPLLLRPWQAGDKIVPLGMKGHKKVSDLLTEEKIPRHKKENILVLVSEDRIVWVAGIRPSEEFKINENTRSFYQATIDSVSF